MKNIFVNEDGTIKLKAVVYTIGIFLFLVLLLMYFISQSTSSITDGNEEQVHVSERTTTTMSLCKDCKMSFIRDSYDAKTNEEINLNNLLELKSINIRNIKLSGYDEGLIEIKSSKEGLVIKTLNKLGSTKIKASYQDKESEMTINVFSDVIKSAKMIDNYYVYLDDFAQLTLETDPENVDASFFNVFSDDESIAKVNGGSIIGVSLGKTRLNLKYADVLSSSYVYVIKSRIAIYLMEGNSLKEYSTYKTNTKSFNVLVKSLDKDIIKDDLTYTIDNGKIEYIEPDIEEPNTFKYSVDLSENNAYMEFTLSDGSKTGLEVLYEN